MGRVSPGIEEFLNPPFLVLKARNLASQLHKLCLAKMNVTVHAIMTGNKTKLGFVKKRGRGGREGKGDT